MSGPNQKDFKPVIIHGKNVVKSRDINLSNIHSKDELHRTDCMNIAALERKIDDGIITVPKTVSDDIAKIFKEVRMNIKNAEGNIIKQDAFAIQCCVPKVDVKFIQQLESGQLLLNHDNKMIVRKLQAKLKIPHFDL